MARVTYGESITEYAGSIGGVTFLRNASGPIAKLRSNPPVNPSPYQSTYQTLFAMLVAYWPTLSQGDKDDWDTLAADHDHTTPWGETKTLSGFQWFLCLNLLRYHYYDTVLETPAVWSVYDPPPQFTIETDAAYIRATWDPPYAFSNLLLYCSLPLKQSSLKLRRSLFYLAYKRTGSPVTNWDFTSLFETLAGVTWGDFYASANCNIIVRILNGSLLHGYFSFFTSAIIKIS